MATKRNLSRKHFWLVVLGLALLVSLIAGGTYRLEEQGLVSVGGEAQDGPPVGMIDLIDGDEMPSPPDREGEDGGLNTHALGGVFKVMLQIGLVVVIVAGGQELLSWLQRRPQLKQIYKNP